MNNTTLVEVKVNKDKFQELISNSEIVSRFKYYDVARATQPLRLTSKEKVIRYFDYSPFRFVEEKE